MSETIAYLKQCKNYFEEKYIYNLTYIDICFIMYYFGLSLGFGYRLYYDGLSYNTLFPIWIVKSNTQFYDYILLGLIVAGPIGFTLGTYIDNVKTRIFIKKYNTEPIKISYCDTFKKNLKIMYRELCYFLRLS